MDIKLLNMPSLEKLDSVKYLRNIVHIKLSRGKHWNVLSDQPTLLLQTYVNILQRTNHYSGQVFSNDTLIILKVGSILLNWSQFSTLILFNFVFVWGMPCLKPKENFELFQEEIGWVSCFRHTMENCSLISTG